MMVIKLGTKNGLIIEPFSIERLKTAKATKLKSLSVVKEISKYRFKSFVYDAGKLVKTRDYRKRV
jgi:hypothetical protein